MSLVEQLFPASELAAMKHAILKADEQPAAKRRKVDRQHSVRSRYSTDSGYNSDESSRSSKPALSHLATSKASISQGPASPATSQSDEEDFCEKIARARARLYSNASLNIPSPPASTREAESPNTGDSLYEEYHSPVSVEPLADTSTTSGCNLGTFISLGLAVTSYERNLLSSLAPEPRAMPSYNAELRARKLQWLRRRRELLMQEQLKQQQSERKPSYAGFAIPVTDDEPEEESLDTKDQADSGIEQCESPPSTSIEQIDDFFNIEAACEQEEKPSQLGC